MDERRGGRRTSVPVTGRSIERDQRQVLFSLPIYLDIQLASSQSRPTGNAATQHAPCLDADLPII